MMIRKAHPEHASAVAQLFYETVHRVNARDYRLEQLQAWAPRVYPDTFWKKRFRTRSVFVAEQAGEVVGFAELTKNREIDGFFVSHAHQGEGIGSALLARIEREARKRGFRRLEADVSLTAEPFFRKRGFRRVRRQKRIYRNQVFRQFRMSKRL